MRPLRRNFTYVNVVSIVVILASVSATALAAGRVYTGANVKDSTLTAMDFKASSIEARDIAVTSRNMMRGRKGSTGPTGDKGAPGPQGLVGETGDRGKSAHSLVRFASFQSAYLREDISNSTDVSWDAETYGGGTNYPNFRAFYDITQGQRQPIDITNNEPPLIALTGLSGVATQGTIRPTAAGLVTATATLTVLHQHHGQGSNHGTAGLATHGRLRCKLRIADGGASIGDGTPTMGAHEWISSQRRHKVYTITMTGSKRVLSASAATNYNVGVTCADVDWTGTTQWKFLSGTVQAHAIYTQS